MASVTQTIPTFSLGMSEQPDNLKFPGQVTDIVNGIPDVTNGLFKRPGAKRIGTSPLASVASGGSYFHYFRDESEGSYIGQVAPNGTFQVWSCNDGTAVDVVYGHPKWKAQSGNASLSRIEYFSGDKIQHTSGGTARIYEAQATIAVGSAPPTHSSGTVNNWAFVENASAAQTRITNYLTTATPENLQFLTINDTTFVNNRDETNANTLVGKTGTTQANVNTNLAFVEVIRAENGRQYGLDIFNSATVTDVKRVTRIKVIADTLYTGAGSGQCKGIVTEVFSVTANSSYTSTPEIISVKDSSDADLTNSTNRGTNGGPPKNLIFRINTLGQQGPTPNGTNFNSADDYVCSYQTDAVLLHGGEGWEVGDKIVVTPQTNGGGGTSNPSTSAGSVTTPVQYTVEVEAVETSQINATVVSASDGFIRPEPTPFDSDTTVTADTILGGLQTQINAISGVSSKIIGNGIYIFSDTQAFTVNVVESDLLRVMQESINDVQNLPNQCKDGYIVKVANSLRADEDDYYLRFDGQGGNDGTGTWTECAKPGIDKSLTNMPLALQRTDGGSFPVEFTMKEFVFDDRDVGDDITNPMPSFVGQRINKVLFFRNRLAFLAGENVVTSRPGTLGKPDFFIQTALTVSTSDPVDISAASTFPSDLFDGIELPVGLLIFSTNQQFLLSSDDTVFNPDTAKLRAVSTFNYNEDMAPISLGTTVAYIDNSGKFSRFNEMANTSREGEPSIVEVSKVVPTLLPKDVDLLTNSRENSIVLIGKTDTDTVFGYRYFQTGDKRAQAAWFKWKFNENLRYHFIINDEYFFLDTDNYLQSIKLVQTENDPSTTINNVDFLLHVDNHTTISGGNFDSTTNTTTFSGVGWLSTVSSPNHDLVVIDEGGTPAPTKDQGRYGKCTVSGTTITVPGNWQGVTLTIGYLYPYQVKIPTLYPTKVTGQSSSSDVNSSLVLHRVKFHFGKIGLYESTLERVGKADYTEVYESTNMNIYNASRAPYLEEHIQTVPVYERNTNVEITLKSSHPAPATLRALSWEGDYSPKYYNRV